MSDSGDVIKVDQEHLETVIPALGTVPFRAIFADVIFRRSSPDSIGGLHQRYKNCLLA